MAHREQAQDSLGGWLRRHREQQGLSREELAARTEPPISPDTIANVERGRTRSYKQTLEILFVALGLEAAERNAGLEAWRAMSAASSEGAASLVPANGPSVPARSLPSGTVTFLFTDVEGSVSAWLRNPQTMGQALARHDALIEHLVSENGGQVVRPRGEGDSRFAVFARASDGLAAACAIQLALVEERWPLSEPLRVRMAVHSGEADLRLGDYYGPAVNHCARLRGVAYGGQVLVSEVTANLVRESLTEEVSLRDLGLHQLKDLRQPERVWQLGHPKLRLDFPTLVTHRPRAHNLPNQLSSFVDRETELAALTEQVSSARLVTLTGTGGSGKSRLALTIASAMVDWIEFPDGVWLVELAPLGDPVLLPEVVAARVGVKEQSGRPIRDTLVEELRSRSLLLVLDNCEHIVEACATLADNLLRNCPGLRILATSREPLRIPGERMWRVPPLPAPDAGVTLALDELAKNPAVRLFMERAQAVQSTLTLTAETSPAIAGICARLDGLPLAIELAAARARVLTQDQILSRLDDSVRLLVGGTRTAPTRQQSLRSTLDWSYLSLSSAERERFERLAVFAGGFDLNGVEAIWSDDEGEAAPDTLDVLTGLVDRSLVTVQPQASGMRFRLLEPVRQYAQERLTERGTWEVIRRQHAAYFLRLIEQAEEGLKGADAEAWEARLELEQGNVRAVLRRCLDAAEAETPLRICTALRNFWHQFGYRHEGLRWLEGALSLESDVTITLRANALHTAGELAFWVGDSDGASARFEQAAEHCRALDDRAGLGAALTYYGRVVARSAQTAREYERGKAMMREAIALNRETGKLWWAAWAMHFLGTSAWEHTELELAEANLSEAEVILRELGETHGRSHVVLTLGGVVRDQGDWLRGERLLEESLAVSRALNCLGGAGEALYFLAGLTRLRGELVVAAQLAVECLPFLHRVGHAAPLVNCVELLGGLACEQGQPERSARLFSVAAAFRQKRGVPMPPILRPAYERDLAMARSSISPNRFATAWAEGSAMTIDQLVGSAR